MGILIHSSGYSGYGYNSGNDIVRRLYCNNIQDCKNDFIDELGCPDIDPNTTYLCQVKIISVFFSTITYK